MASTLVDTKIETENYRLDGSASPSSLGDSTMIANAAASMSTTWLKLNSSAPIHIQLEGAAVMPENEPFSGAKKLRYILENTNELVICPGVYDGLSARTAIELGFKSLYMVSNQAQLNRLLYDGEIFPCEMWLIGCRLVLELLLRGWGSLTLPLPSWLTVSDPFFLSLIII